MNIADNLFNEKELDILRSAKGQKLLTLDTVIVARGDLSWQKVRLHLERLHIDLICKLSEVVMDEFGTTDEFSILEVQESTEEILSLPEVSADTTVVYVNSIVENIEVINTQIDVYGDGKRVASISNAQALIFHLEDSVLVLDKENWFSEMIAVKSGSTADELIYDDSENWVVDPVEDPTTQYEYQIERVCL